MGIIEILQAKNTCAVLCGVGKDCDNCTKAETAIIKYLENLPAMQMEESKGQYEFQRNKVREEILSAIKADMDERGEL